MKTIKSVEATRVYMDTEMQPLNELAVYNKLTMNETANITSKNYKITSIVDMETKT